MSLCVRMGNPGVDGESGRLFRPCALLTFRVTHEIMSILIRTADPGVDGGSGRLFRSALTSQTAQVNSTSAPSSALSQGWIYFSPALCVAFQPVKNCFPHRIENMANPQYDRVSFFVHC